MGLEQKVDERGKLVAYLVRQMVHEGVGQPPRRVGFDDLAGVGDGAVACTISNGEPTFQSDRSWCRTSNAR